MQVWKNLGCSKSEIRSKQTIGWLWLIAVCAFNTVPLLIISILANLSSLTAFVPFLESWSEASPGSFTFLSGVLPPAVSSLFGWALPIIMRKLTKYMGAYTHSRMDRAVVARYYAFLIISQLIIFTLIGVIFSEYLSIVWWKKRRFRAILTPRCRLGEADRYLDRQAQELPGHHRQSAPYVLLSMLRSARSDEAHYCPAELPETINETYIDQASYWLTYFPLRGFLVLFDLAQLLNLFIVFFKTQ